ncbi:MAG: hypothetical protein SGJ26_15675 [Nitrospirota bacterium]|nr:hypothetical protein [Nitrospirota bacterium]
MLPDKKAWLGPHLCFDMKKFDSVFDFRRPDYLNVQDKSRIGCLGNCQVEIPGNSHGQDQCTADFSPSLGQIKDHSIANML